MIEDAYNEDLKNALPDPGEDRYWKLYQDYSGSDSVTLELRQSRVHWGMEEDYDLEGVRLPKRKITSKYLRKQAIKVLEDLDGPLEYWGDFIGKTQTPEDSK